VAELARALQAVPSFTAACWQRVLLLARFEVFVREIQVALRPLSIAPPRAMAEFLFFLLSGHIRIVW
jgi:hypothetical protein